MPHIIRRLHLSRRTILRGAGASVALPWLDAMCPALAPRPKNPTRSVFIFAPNGKKMDDWTPASTGAEFELPHLLQPLSELRRHVSVFSNLGIDAGRAHGDGPGDHARAAASFLTCAHPRKTGGADIHVGVSIDQIMARRRARETVFPSLELGMEAGRKSGSCDSGYSCAYSNNIAWRDPSTPVAKEVHPRAAFTRMFGAIAGDPKEEARKRRRSKSVLDAVLADARSLSQRLGAADRGKLDQYLTGVRAIEARLQKLERDSASVRVPEGFRNRAESSHFVARLRLMYEVILLALQTDQTRTVSFMLGNAGSNRSYRFLDVPNGHHSLSHHRGDKKKLAKIRKINRFHVEEFARFLDALAQTRDGDASLLHRSMIVYGSGLGDGNRHDHLQLPILLAGHGNGRLTPGQHTRFPRRTPLANMYLSMLRALEIEARSFADSTDTLNI